MTPEMRRFLTARFLTMLGWLVLLVAGFVLFNAVTRHIDNDPLRWVANLLTLLATVSLGLLLQGRLLAHVDPDGNLRKQVAALGEGSAE